MSFSSEENYLRVGKNFLEKGDYERAIEQLKKVCETTTDSSLFTSAQKLLISAYEKTGNIEAAINLCKQLQTEGEIRDQIWVTQQLNQLSQSQNSSNLTGFVADTPSEPSSIPPLQKTVEKLERPQQAEEKNEAIADIKWQNALKSFKEPSLIPLWQRTFISLITFFCLLDISAQVYMDVTNWLFVKLPSPYFNPVQAFYRDQTLTLMLSVIIIFIASPWILTGGLKFFYECRPFPLYSFAIRCPQSAEFLKTYCRQQKNPFPELGILPSAAPIIFSYRKFPDQGRIILSEGLLEQLTDEEITTLLAGELGMIGYLPSLFFTSAIGLLQIPYLLYFQLSVWGEWLYQGFLQLPHRFVPKFFRQGILPLIRVLIAYVSNLFYLVYIGLRLPFNWLFQIQHSYRDYLSVSLTGNPNGKVRALIKIARGIKEDIETQKQTSFLLESFNPLFPIGYRQGLYFGVLAQSFSLEEILNWEGSQEYRHHLNWFNSHPLISDRVTYLLKQGKLYKLPLELDINPATSSEEGIKNQFQKLINAYQVFPLFLRSIYLGIFLGILLRIILFAIGIVSNFFDLSRFTWLSQSGSFLGACILLIFSLSLIIGMNHYFPNIKPSQTKSNPSLFPRLSTLNHPQAVYPLRIKGELLGRSGISNWLGQDFILKTETGSIYIHVSSQLGMIGNWFFNFPLANQFIQKPIVISGWVRRSVIPWLDVERMMNHKRRSIRAGYPIWLTILALGAAIFGSQLILRG